VKTTDKVTLHDVARQAGCSLATASRVMNDNQTVGGEVRERVMKAAGALGYVPNGSARALRSTQTRLVGAVIPTVDHAIYASMINALQGRLGERRISLILATSMYDPELELVQVRQLLERGVEAVVLVGARHRQATLDLLDQHRVPHVQTYAARATGSGVAVGFDNESAGRAAARFLLELGHRRLAMIAGITQDNDRAKERVTGFLAELAAAGVAADSVPVREAPYSVAAGSAALRDILAAGVRPTAVFCASDLLAAGAIKHCNGAGIDVPGQLSVLGFDNLEIAELTTPELTTFEVPARDMGRLAADYITASPTQRLHMRGNELAIRLAVRGSTGAAPELSASAAGAGDRASAGAAKR
jgi:LacI family transcriptional regulator